MRYEIIQSCEAVQVVYEVESFLKLGWKLAGNLIVTVHVCNDGAVVRRFFQPIMHEGE